MQEPPFPTRDEKQLYARIAAEAFDNDDAEEEWKAPHPETVKKILIHYARLIGLR